MFEFALSNVADTFKPARVVASVILISRVSLDALPFRP